MTQAALRFALPGSLGLTEANERAKQLERYLSGTLLRSVEVVVASRYDVLAKELLSGRVHAAWAPPFICARIEAMGVRVVVRGVRHGASSYRAALVCRKGAGLTLETLNGTRAIWADKDSVGGYLLAMAFLRGRGVDPNALFSIQRFAGSYESAIEQVLSGQADLTSVFAAPQGSTGSTTGAEAMGHADKLEVVTFTDESPNDGVAVGMNVEPAMLVDLERTLLTLHETGPGEALLKQAFDLERFEPAPRLGYRALYRVALASV